MATANTGSPVIQQTGNGFQHDRTNSEDTKKSHHAGGDRLVIQKGDEGPAEILGRDYAHQSAVDKVTDFPNPYAKFRHTMREYFAEFLGTMVLVLFGCGGNLQATLSSSTAVTAAPKGAWWTVAFGWGVGVGLGAWVAGGISGGHINPAVTLAFATFRGFSWKKVPGYMLSQLLGAMVGAAICYGMYRRAITLYEGGPDIRTITGDHATAGCFGTFPLDYLSKANGFFGEFIGSFLLLLLIFSITDRNNGGPPDGLNPIVLFLVVTAVGACFGMQTSFAINPARDLGPRLITWMAGYSREVFNFGSQYWLYAPCIGSFAGMLVAGFVYDVLIYTGPESPVNYEFGRKKSPSYA